MPGIQGKRCSIEQVARIKYLLAETEMTVHEIARRMGTSASTIVTINRRSDIRRYNGSRSRWEKGSKTGTQAAVPYL